MSTGDGRDAESGERSVSPPLDSNTPEENVLSGEQSPDEEPTFSLNLSLPSTTPQSSHDRKGQRPRVAASAPTKSPWNPTLRRDKLRKLRAIQQVLRCRLPSFQVKCLPKARIPILMAVDPVSGLNVDIGINRETLEASDHGRTTALVSDLQVSFGQPFTAVVTFLKEFLHQFDLDKPFTGGLGSYRLYMMVAFILTRGGKGKGMAPTCSSVLLEFFGLYGNRAKPGFLSEATQLTVHHGQRMDVVDFAAVFRLQDCIDHFAMAHDILRKHQSLGHVLFEERVEMERRDCLKRMTKRLRALEARRAQSEDALVAASECDPHIDLDEPDDDGSRSENVL
ncbi:hypothetical protein PINS_up002966 [Pythium insidiosum]|nr:hypothetical protein PINS_up002966 [Pythium insidiosum]